MRIENEIVAGCGHRVRVVIALDEFMRRKNPAAVYAAALAAWDTKNDKCSSCANGSGLTRTVVDFDDLIDRVKADFDSIAETGEQGDE